MNIIKRIAGYLEISECIQKQVIAIAPEGRPDLTLSVGDIVVSNGRMPKCPQGLTGVVVAFYELFTGIYSSDIIQVQWFNGWRSNMKFEDLDIDVLASRHGISKID